MNVPSQAPERRVAISLKTTGLLRRVYHETNSEILRLAQNDGRRRYRRNAAPLLS